MFGRPFPITDYVRKIYNRYILQPAVVSEQVQPVAVTAVHSGNFDSFAASTGSFFYHHPWSVLLVYDVGLNQTEIDIIKSLPNKFIYKQLNFDKYPSYVRTNLKSQAYKTIIFTEVLQKYGAILYFDPTVNFFKPVTQLVENMKSDGRSFASFEKHNHFSVIFGMDIKMNWYLPANFTNLQNPKNLMKSLNAVVIFNTKQFKYEIMRWAILCTLTEACLLPPDYIEVCAPGAHRFKEYTCHLPTTVLYNILLSNFYGIEKLQQKRYYVGNEYVLVNRKLGEFQTDKGKFGLNDQQYGLFTKKVKHLGVIYFFLSFIYLASSWVSVQAWF